MDRTTEFLRSVLPDIGRYCLVSMDGGRSKEKKITHDFNSDLNAVIRGSKAKVNQGRDVYFAIATYGEANSRTVKNAVRVRTFFMDLDWGEGKKYQTIGEAEAALRLFCLAVKLPYPTLVSSGYGLHVYWALDDCVDIDTWLPIAKHFMAVSEAFDFGYDPGVPLYDAARILRVPGTKNFKSMESPRPVSVVNFGTVLTLQEFNAALLATGVPRPVEVPPRETSTSSIMQALLGNQSSNFGVIARASLSGKGCNAIKHVITQQDKVPEPLWFSALSVAQHCEDGETAIHKLSSKHPEYDYNETVRKAAGAEYPHTCETFRDRAPDLCRGCPLSIKSPIVLGRHIARAAVVDVEEDTDVIAEVELTAETVEEPDTLHPPVKINYAPPFPYFRGKNGGVYRESKDADGAKIEELVYEHEFYAVQRMNDPQAGEVILFKLVLPHDGEREFSIPLAEIHSSEKFKATVGKHGIVGAKKQMEAIMSYAIRYTKELQMRGRAREARLQFGWTPKRDGFVVGNRVYTASKILHNPASSATSEVIHLFEPTGSLTEWKSVINALAKPGMEPLQFAALCGFGSPLIPFSGVSGVTVNLLSNESGTGKTTATQIAMSVFGHPKDTLINSKDTVNARDHKFGVLNNLCAGSDEMTNQRPEDVSDMVYATSHGKGKDRMEGQTNKLRNNTTQWNLINVSNSNASMISKLAKLKARADGELMRLIELPVDRVEIPDGEKIFNRILTNYGVAGPVYAQWIVKNRDKLQRLIDKQRDAIWEQAGKQMEERFIVAVIAVVLTAGRIAQSLELHDLDMNKLQDWAIRTMLRAREVIEDETHDSESLLGDFLLEHVNSIIGVNKEELNPFTASAVFYPPRSSRVVARLEVGQPSFMFISKKAFRDYCVDRQFTMSSALEECTDASSPFRYLGHKKKRLLADSGMLAPATDCLIFECSDDESEALKRALSEAAKRAQVES